MGILKEFFKIQGNYYNNVTEEQLVSLFRFLSDIKENSRNATSTFSDITLR